MAVIILGAGATRGASFVQDAPCKPPLDSDFFTQLQRVRQGKHRALVDKVVQDAIELFGVNFKATLETAFTTLEHTRNIITTTGETKSFKRSQLSEKRDRLLQALAAVFEESLCVAHSHRMKRCSFHDALVHMLREGDTIISFNYDCTIDDSLRRLGQAKWNPRYGYVLPLGKGHKVLPGEEHWSATGERVEKRRTIRLLKLHGSMHFKEYKDRDQIRVLLKERPYTKQRGALQFTIVPPESDKPNYSNSFFPSLWRIAARELQRATTIAVIGYSVPPTDMYASALFRVAVKGQGLHNLIVANPDADARRRIREIFKLGLSSQTKVFSFDSFEQFVGVERDLWDRELAQAHPCRSHSEVEIAMIQRLRLA
jgi:SIR2-like domain